MENESSIFTKFLIELQAQWIIWMSFHQMLHLLILSIATS